MAGVRAHGGAVHEELCGEFVFQSPSLRSLRERPCSASGLVPDPRRCSGGRWNCGQTAGAWALGASQCRLCSAAHQKFNPRRPCSGSGRVPHLARFRRSHRRARRPSLELSGDGKGASHQASNPRRALAPALSVVRLPPVQNKGLFPGERILQQFN
ncbi:hypothetical protein BRADI_1g29103v3 [Brachypodium distachyon]|uniref:Uncharacterized protein n=1 Tax=Brachypodium distachyon TaxID=15368 RepID=A0A0Q3KZH0_BRADI|nr:hypothetical protein BRADI_1g29103v3 [Brachypodium distachyon]